MNFEITNYDHLKHECFVFHYTGLTREDGSLIQDRWYVCWKVKSDRRFVTCGEWDRNYYIGVGHFVEPTELVLKARMVTKAHKQNQEFKNHING